MVGLDRRDRAVGTSQRYQAAGIPIRSEARHAVAAQDAGGPAGVVWPEPPAPQNDQRPNITEAVEAGDGAKRGEFHPFRNCEAFADALDRVLVSDDQGPATAQPGLREAPEQCVAKSAAPIR